MSTITIQGKKFLPFLQSKRHGILFMFINIYLIIGVCSLWITMFYLLGHLNNADSIIKYCIPGFVLGISSGIIYFIGYQSMISDQHDKKHPRKFNS
jgi:hypothetical protein